MMKRTSLYLLSLSVVLLLVLAACAQPGGGAATSGGSSSSGETTITMTESKFDPDTIQVKAGQEVTLRLVNEGEKEHEILFGRNLKMEEGAPGGYEVDLFERDPNQVEASGGEGFHEGTPEEIAEEGYHVELEPGAEGTLVFTVPASKAGEWEMGCFIDDGAHYDEGMKGTFVVEE